MMEPLWFGAPTWWQTTSKSAASYISVISVNISNSAPDNLNETSKNKNNRTLPNHTVAESILAATKHRISPSSDKRERLLHSSVTWATKPFDSENDFHELRLEVRRGSCSTGPHLYWYTLRDTGWMTTVRECAMIRGAMTAHQQNICYDFQKITNIFSHFFRI